MDGKQFNANNDSKDNSAINDRLQTNAIYSDLFIMLVEDSKTLVQ